MIHHCPKCNAVCGCDGHDGELPGRIPADCTCCTVCVMCGEARHLGDCRQEPQEPPEQAEPAPALLVCPICGSGPWRNESALNGHRAIHSQRARVHPPRDLPTINGKWLFCPACGRGCRSTRSLAIHQSKAHGVLGSSPQSCQRRAKQVAAFGR